MKILFIPNWNVKRLSADDPTVQPPDKVVDGEPYWFFRYFPPGTRVDVLDRGGKSWLRNLEERIKFYIKQPVKAFLRRNDYDLVISHGAQSGLVYELLASFARRKPAHIMIDVGGLNGARINRTETPLIRWALRQGPHVVVHSSRQLGLYSHYPALQPKARFIPFGADQHFFQPEAVPVQRTIVSFGHRKRDYDTLLRAFESIADHRGYNLFIVGDTGMQPTAALRDVSMMPRVTIDELQRYLARCSFVALPLPEYQYSYGQMSLLQSMLMGKTVVATSTTSTADYIDGAPGVIPVGVGDAEQLAGAISRAMDLGDEERARLGNLNRQHVINNFPEERMGTELASLAREAIDEKQP